MMMVRCCLTVVLCLFVGCSTSRDAARPPDHSSDRAPSPTTRTVDGFRLQLTTTPEKAAADRQAADAADWWETLSAAQRSAFFTDTPPAIDVVWRQPYYRVHLGTFASRAEAQDALALAKRSFPDAFLVPAVVTITR